MSSGVPPIRIALHIDVVPGSAGGIAQSTQGLVSSLGRLEGPETYLLSVSTDEEAAWVERHRGPNQQIVRRSASRRMTSDGVVRSALRPLARKVRSVAGRLLPPAPRVELSDGFYESLQCDVLHFPTQGFFLCALPTIYNPHDLQHLHYPQFWNAWEIAHRETMYRAACQYANTVVVGSQWIKDDVVRQYAVHPDKVQIIPWAPPTTQYPDVSAAEVAEVKARLALPDAFALYPAVTWPHKNHLRLFEAMAMLRDRQGLVVQLVCTGSRWAPHWPRIEAALKQLKLESQVRFLGFVPESDLRALYRLAQFLVLPTLFEADSCPVHEAWSEGLAVASSNHAAMPDQIGDAALAFDAMDVDQIVDALRRMATDDALRADLAARGRRRVGDFDWIRTAKAYRAVYRRAARVHLGEEDRALLAWDWMRHPGSPPSAPAR